MTSLLRYVLAIIFAVFFASASAADFSGTVVAVLDGDTIDVLVDKTPIRVRLAGIDAPEKSQPFGSRSKIALSNLVYAKQVLVQDQGPDRYGRRIGFVWMDGVSINLRQVEAGMAWVYRQYTNDASFLRAETNARAIRRGLWTDTSPVPPWEYRHSTGVRTSETARPLSLLGK
ncbi:thermonuclease family protein [Cupriavidus sp. D39]|uniref:thermonuclease family protein n=1 Tax=Cupriavidus sp. D39 TaxID=2997877 RepID=UPI00226D48DC|nr:thermonuclease family protein [Cupriavidus sp. D39]MCY0853004.1 thermonuclease family protein [Cupriavidus sp. D39]